MGSGIERKMSSKRWRLFIEEVRTAWRGRGLEVPNIGDLKELAVVLNRSAALSHSRSKREAEELFRAFEEKIQRAA
jgi:hypothetical protein